MLNHDDSVNERHAGSKLEKAQNLIEERWAEHYGGLVLQDYLRKDFLISMTTAIRFFKFILSNILVLFQSKFGYQAS